MWHYGDNLEQWTVYPVLEIHKHRLKNGSRLIYWGKQVYLEIVSIVFSTLMVTSDW